MLADDDESGACEHGDNVNEEEEVRDAVRNWSWRLEVSIDSSLSGSKQFNTVNNGNVLWR